MNKLNLKLIIFFALIGATASAQDTLTVNSAIHYQTIEGWGHGGGVLGFLGGAEYMLDSSISKPVNFQTLDFVTSELGLTGSRTWEVGPRVDGTGIDSGGNCDVLDWAKFQSNTLSWQDAQYLIYYKNRIVSEGYQPSFYSSPGYPSHATDSKPWIIYHPGERALQIWSSALYLKNTYGLDINYAVMANEPASPYTSVVLSDDIKACGPRFTAHGLTTMAQFAECINPQIDWNYIVPVDSDATLWPYVGRLSYHNYGTADPYRSQIRDFGLFKGIRTGQTEMGNPGFDDLYADLTLGGVSYWEVAYSANQTLVPSSGLTSFTPSAYYIRLRQVMHYVRPGAIRIGATTNDGNVEVLSFSQGGAITTVIDNKNAGAKTVFISGLPPGTYGLSAAVPGATTFQEYGVQTVGFTGTITVTANGGSSITTLYPRSLANLPPTIMTWGTNPGYLVAPATVATVTATASDPEAGALTYLWTLISSPVGATPVIVSPTTATSSVTGLTVAGTYVFNIAVSDGVNISSKQVYLCAYGSNPPAVLGSAGFRIAAPYGLVFSNPGDTTHAIIELPTSAATLQIGISDLANSDFTGRGTWSLVSQPIGGVAVVGATSYIFVSIRANVTGMTVTGDYVFQVNVTNPPFADLTARIICTVKPATSAPVINSITAFADTITLPVSSDLITAVTTDPSGGTLRHWWEINAVPVGAYPVFDHQGVKVATASNLTIPGTYIFTLRTFNDLYMTTKNVTIIVKQGIGAITGPLSLCAGSAVALSDTSAGGTWSSGNTLIATVGSTGIVTGITGTGTSMITYKVGIYSAFATVTVNALPPAINPPGPTNICAGSFLVLSDATGGGAWSSSSTTVATIDAFGNTNGVSAGTSVITYTASGCNAFKTVTVNTAPGPITGSTLVCAGLTTALSDAGGGTWTSSNTTVATVVPGSGVVTGVSTGTANITYSLGGSCTATITVTVGTSPGAITGNMSVCAGSTATLSDGGAGTWSSSNTSVAAIGIATGVMTGLIQGTSTITYTLGAGCSATSVATINPLPSVITGAANVCAGSTTTLSDAGAGIWSSANTSVATVSGPIVTGATAGTATISYTLGTGCAATTVVTVSVSPAAITGSPNLCVGLTTNLTDVTGSGAWTSSNTSIATVGGTGIVNGVIPGAATITYALLDGCSAVANVVVRPVPAAITGSAVLCTGTTTTLSDAVGGGVWSSGSTAVATIGTTGIVTGVALGTANIVYTMGAACAATKTVTISTGPAPITGATTICTTTMSALSDATALGTWSSSNTSIASVSGLGSVTGVTTGIATISYSIGAGCATTTGVTIINASSAPITGAAAVCVGQTAVLTDATTGGAWNSGATGIATVSGTGIVTGASAGPVTISYSATNMCGTAIVTKAMTVNALPVVAAITGTPNVCVGSTVALSDVTPSGVWSSGATTVATVSPSGVVTGVAIGLAAISYTVTNIAGCVANAVSTITVNLSAPPITGTASVCQGLTTNLSDLTGGGVWSSSNTAIATIGASSGIVTALLPGVPVISYLVAGCMATTTVTVNSLPTVYSVIGGGSYCAGGTGVSVGLNLSAIGANYQLFNGLTLVNTLAGTSSALNFGLQTLAGIYTVVAVNASTGCTSNMAGSAAVTITPLSVATVSITASPGDTICAGGHVTFSAVPVFGGPSPVYQWTKNGVNVGTGPSYIPAPFMNDGDLIGCTMTSDYACLVSGSPVTGSLIGHVDPATWNLDTIQVTRPVITIGQVDTFIVFAPHAGTSPSYQWYLNGLPIPGATNATFVTSALVSTDAVKCQVTSSDLCSLPKTNYSNIIKVLVQTGVNNLVNGAGYFTLVPNPNKGEFTINGILNATDEKVGIVVTDMLGQTIYNKMAQAGNGELNERITLGTSIANGMYLVKITYGEGSRVFHIAVNR